MRLGALVDDGIAPSIFALVDRGVERRPEIAARMRGEVELRFQEAFAPVRIAFAAQEILVEDGAPTAPDLVIAGTLPDIVHLTSAPQRGGVPDPTTSRGRAALTRVVRGRVRVQGDRALARRLLRLLAL